HSDSCLFGCCPCSRRSWFWSDASPTRTSLGEPEDRPLRPALPARSGSAPDRRLHSDTTGCQGGPPHPEIESIVQEKIRKDRANHTTLWGAASSLNCHSIFDHRGCQPSLDVEQRPPTLHVLPNRL